MIDMAKRDRSTSRLVRLPVGTVAKLDRIKAHGDLRLTYGQLIEKLLKSAGWVNPHRPGAP